MSRMNGQKTHTHSQTNIQVTTLKAITDHIAPVSTFSCPMIVEGVFCFVTRSLNTSHVSCLQSAATDVEELLDNTESSLFLAS